MSLDRIRSVAVAVDDLADFIGRNPDGVYRKEEIVEALRGALRGERTFTFSDPKAPRRYSVTSGKEAGTFRLTENR